MKRVSIYLKLRVAGAVNTLPGDIVIKENYWVSLSHGTGGNTIDLLTHVMGMTFRNAMTQIEEFM